MPSFKPWHSIVTRLIIMLVVGGVTISAGLSVLEYQRAATDLRMRLTQRLALNTQHLQNVLNSLLREPREHEHAIHNALAVFTADHPVKSVRLTGPGLEPITRGRWPREDTPANELATARWLFNNPHSTHEYEIALDRPTLVRAPFTRDQQTYQLELHVNGSAAHARMQHQLLHRMVIQGLVLGAILLLALLLMRRWFTGPLNEIVELIDRHAGPEPFQRLSQRHHGEFGRLASAIGGMLGRIEATTADLAQREQTFHSFYQHAPAAMISLDPAGRIIEANHKALSLLRADTRDALIGREAATLVSEPDRPRLHEAINRLAVDETTHCELRLDLGDPPLETALNAAALRDADGQLTAVTLALLDVSDARNLQRRLEDQTRLLNLIIDHMSDAILLVDRQQRVAACNRRLADLLQRHPQALHGSHYEPERFWEPLNPLDRTQLLERLRRIEAAPDQDVQERVETGKGVFQFQSMSLRDADQATVGQLWVVREITAQEQHRRLVRQQHRQLDALKRMSLALGEARSPQDVLTTAANELRELIEVEAVGLILRSREPAPRGRQVIHRGPQAQLLSPNQALAQALERELVPLVLHNADVALWPDLPHHVPWGRAGEAAGLTSLAAGPLRGPHEPLGIAWIARHAGERLERHHLHTLEMLIPTIAARLHIVELEQRLNSLALTDGPTALPGPDLFERAMHWISEHEQHAAILVLAIEAREPQRPWPDANTALDASGALPTVVQRLQNACRRSTFIARLGPGRLGLIVPAIKPEAARLLGERLRATLEDEPVRPAHGPTVTLAARLGVACRPDDGHDLPMLHILAASRADATASSHSPHADHTHLDDLGFDHPDEASSQRVG